MAQRPSYKLRFSIVLVPAAVALCACHNLGPTLGPLPGTQFRLVNLVSDSGGLQATIGTQPAVGPVGYGGASNIAYPDEGSYQVVLTPGAAGAAPYDVNGVTISQDTLTTLFAYGSIAGGTQNGFTVDESLAAPAAGQVTMQVVIAAGGAQNSDTHIYAFTFTPVGSSSPAGSASGSFGPGSPSQTIALATGKYEIKVTLQVNCAPPALCVGAPTLIFDSGPQGVSIPGIDEASVFQLAAVDAPAQQQSQYGSPIALLLLDSNNGEAILFNGQQ